MTKTSPPIAQTKLETSGTVERVIKLLAVLADSGEGVAISMLSETLSLPASTVHRLLNLLRKQGIVEWHAGTRHYGIGTEFFRISAKVVAAVDITRLAQPYLDEIVKEFNETMLLGLYLPGQKAMSFAARADGSLMLRYRVDLHEPLPLIWGASGKSILAYLPDDVVTEISATASASPASGLLPPTHEALLEELAQIRACGISVTESEKLAGARGIAAPIFSHHGVVGCLCLTCPRDRAPTERVSLMVHKIAESAAALSGVLGAPLNAASRNGKSAQSPSGRKAKVKLKD